MITLPLSISSCLNDDDIESEQKQFDREQKAIDAYLDGQGIDYEIESIYGLRYFLEGTGNDTLVQTDDYLDVSFSGFLLGQTTPFITKDTVINLAQYVPGWRILMPKSEGNQTITMFIPSYYGYGRYGSTSLNIPANSTLMYEVETTKAHDGFTYQQLLIDNYLEANELEFEIDSVQSLRYIILEQGNGDKPTKNSSVNVSYKGSILNGAEFDDGSNVTFSLSTLIAGWGVLLPYVKEGGKIKMFIPAKFGYGLNYIGTIPPNSILVFEVELNNVL